MYQYKLFEIEEDKIKLIKSYVDQFKFPKNRPIKRIQWDPVHPIAPIRVNIGKCIFCGHNLEFHIRSGLDMVTCESCESYLNVTHRTWSLETSLESFIHYQPSIVLICTLYLIVILLKL